MEVDTYFDTISAMAIDDPEWLGLAPLRILSFDIECAGRKDVSMLHSVALFADLLFFAPDVPGS